ncbi:MAG: RNA polymerase sigma factor [Lentisphaerales bacterium]|nr:RNA polymerase sigma factor [Lentisphaerales bacterium]
MTDDKYLTRQTLIMRACNQDDESAWEEFVEFYQKFIYHILHKMNISLNDFEDLVQVVLLQLWKGLSTYRAEESKFRTWLSRVTRNTVLSYLDKMQRQVKRQEQMGDLQEALHHLNSYSQAELEKMIESEWQAYVTTMALENIRPLFSGMAIEAFLLNQKGKSGEEIAKALDLKKESVYVLVSRVKNKFVDEMRSLIRELEL